MRLRPAAADAGGLCDSCSWRQQVPSSRGQVYVLCRQSSVDPTFERYPVLPVFDCGGYRRVDPVPPDSTNG